MFISEGGPRTLHVFNVTDPINRALLASDFILEQALTKRDGGPATQRRLSLSVGLPAGVINPRWLAPPSPRHRHHVLSANSRPCARPSLPSHFPGEELWDNTEVDDRTLRHTEWESSTRSYRCTESPPSHGTIDPPVPESDTEWVKRVEGTLNPMCTVFIIFCSVSQFQKSLVKS